MFYMYQECAISSADISLCWNFFDDEIVHVSLVMKCRGLNFKCLMEKRNVISTLMNARKNLQ